MGGFSFFARIFSSNLLSFLLPFLEKFLLKLLTSLLEKLFYFFARTGRDPQRCGHRGSCQVVGYNPSGCKNAACSPSSIEDIEVPAVREMKRGRRSFPKCKLGKSKNGRMKDKDVMHSGIQMPMHCSRCKRAGHDKFSCTAEIGESSSAAERRHGGIEGDSGAGFNVSERRNNSTAFERDEAIPSSNHGSFPNIQVNTLTFDYTQERTPQCTRGRGIGKALGSVWRGIRRALSSVCRGGRQATVRGGRGRGRNTHIQPTLTPVHQYVHTGSFTQSP